MNQELIMEFFKYLHLPASLQEVSAPFCRLAEKMVETLPRCAERSDGLRKLLDAQSDAVRAALTKPA